MRAKHQILILWLAKIVWLIFVVFIAIYGAIYGYT
jgi:hypothetical protein